MRHYQMYINGAWRDSDTCNPVLDKFTNTPYAQYAVTTPEEVNEAVAAAQRSASMFCLELSAMRS